MIVDASKRKLFRPSSAPGKEHCSHFEAEISFSDKAERGVITHGQLKEMFDRAKQNQEFARLVGNSFKTLDYAAKTVLASKLKQISSVEESVEIYLNGEFITEGTTDLYGYAEDGVLQVYDWKTGMERDYTAQVDVYALGLMERTGVKVARTYEVFVDQERTYVRDISRDQARDRVSKIVAGIRNPRSPHTINKYCDWCSLRLFCPAWEAERSRSLSIYSSEDHHKRDLQKDLLSLKDDPPALGKFIAAFRYFKKMVKAHGVEEAALEKLQKGNEVPGLHLQLREGFRTINAEEFIKAVGLEKALPALRVDMEAASSIPGNYKISRTSPTQYVAVNRKKSENPPNLKISDAEPQ